MSNEDFYPIKVYKYNLLIYFGSNLRPVARVTYTVLVETLNHAQSINRI